MKKINKMFLITTFIFGAFFTLNLITEPDYLRNATEQFNKENKDEDSFTLNLDDFPISLASDESENQLPEPNSEYEYYRNLLLDRFNLTYGDYLNMNEEDSGMFHNYTIAMWGRENGTLTEEEGYELIEHNSPIALGLPNKDRIIRNTDGSFWVKFSIVGRWGEMVRRVEAWIDDDERNLHHGDKRKRMRIQELTWPWKHGRIEDDGYSWVGKIEWLDTAHFEIWCAPGFLDDCVEIEIAMKWYFLDIWDWFDPWKDQGYKWERTDHTYYVKDWFFIFPILGSRPIKVVDDDPNKPIVSSYIVDQEDGRYKGFYSDPNDRPIKIVEDKTYKYTGDQGLFILSKDDSPPGSLHMEYYAVIDSYETYIDTIEVELVEKTIYSKTLWLGIWWDTEEDYYGYGISLADLAPGTKYKFVVKVTDSDYDRGEIDRETSDPLTFYLSSDAISSSAPDFGSFMGAGGGAAQLVQNLDGVIPDTDFSHIDLQTDDEYEVFPYKKDTTPTEMSFDIQYYNPFDFPIRIKLEYNQFENSPRLSTHIDIDQFKIVENGLEGRDNIYHGFGSGTAEEIESSVFNSFIPSEINSGGTGVGTLWIELKPKETKIFEDFLTIRVEDFELLSHLELQMLMDEISKYIETANSLSSVAFDFMTYGIFDEAFQTSYSPDDVSNLYNALHLNEYLLSLKAVSNFGIKVENVYYPKAYIPSDDVAIWNNTFCITDREILNLFLMADDEETLGYTHDSQTGYNTFRFAFYPTDEQVSAFTTFIHQIILRDTLLYISSFGSNLPDENPYKELLEVFPMATAVGISPLLYHFVEIMNGINPLDTNYYEQPNPGLMQVLIDQFPELQQDNELAIRTISYLEKSFGIERELQGYYKSMNRYRTATINNQWSYASNQLIYASEFSKNANQIMNGMAIDLTFILAAISDGLSKLGMDTFSNANIDNFEYNARYLANTYNQANFRSTDENTNYLTQTAHRFLFYNTPGEIRELGRNALNSISFFSSAKFTFKNLEKTCVHEAINIQTNKLSSAIINDADTQELITILKVELLNASIFFDSKLYQLCIDTLEAFNDFVLDKYVETRNPEFSQLYYEGSRLSCLAQKSNQIDFEVFDVKVKETINGKSQEYIFQIHNDINYAMFLNKEFIVPEFSTIGLPPEVNFRITYLNSTELPRTLDGRYYIPIGPEKSILLKYVVDIPLNSPFELETYNFEMLASSEFIDKSINYRQNFTLSILEDDLTPPEVTLSYNGNGYDSDPGILEFSVIEDDYGSEATGNLTIIGPDGYIYKEQFAEGTNNKDLNDLTLSPGDYTATLFVENNDEDRGDIDEETDQITISFTILDDDTDAPVLTLDYDGNGFDGSPGSLTFSILEASFGSDATGNITIEGPFGFFVTSEIYTEGTFTIYLNTLDPKLCELGFYTVTLYAENNDEDGWEGDEESTSISIEFEITDDDELPPVIMITMGEINWYTPGELVSFTFLVEATDESGFSSIYINIGTYTADFLGYHEAILPENFYDLIVTIIDGDNDRIIENDMLSSTEIVYDIILDLTPPVTEIIIAPFYDDGLGNNYVTSATLFTLEATDEVSGVAHTYYWIDDGPVNEDILTFSLTDLPDGTYRIYYKSIDEVGNEEDIKFVDVILVGLDIESYITEDEFGDTINNFDVIFRKCKVDGVEGFMLVATNPGQVFYHIDITNNWPIPVDELTIYANIPSGFVTQGSGPIHVFLDGVEITESCIIVDGIITVFDVPSGSVVEIVIHLDYALKETFYEELEAFWLKTYNFEPVIHGFGGDLLDESNLLTGTYGSSNEFKSFQKKVTAIAGFVTDQNGNPVLGAMVELKLTDGTIIKTFTDENGFYFFTELTSGDYQIRVVYADGETEWQCVIAIKDEVTWIDYVVSILIL